MNALFPTINSWYVVFGSIILAGSAGLLGCFAVLRRQGLLADALAHASLPGIVLAFLLMKTKFLPGLLLGALLLALCAAGVIILLQRITPLNIETILAAVLSIFFGLGIVLLTAVQHMPLASQSGLETFLFGQAAALLRTDVLWIGAMFGVVLAFVLVFWKELKLFTFDPVQTQFLGFRRWLLEFLFTTFFVVSILMSLQAVGVVLTAALFITPATAALLWTKRLSLAVVLSCGFGMVAGFLGAVASTHIADMPTGPAVVLILTAIFIFSFVFSPGKGVLFLRVKKYRRSLKIKTENAMAYLYRGHEQGRKTWKKEEYEPYIHTAGIKRRLLRFGYIYFQDNMLLLTKEGMLMGAKIITKHRLWETYLNQQMFIDPERVHHDAEEIEHVLTDEMVRELERNLGNPQQDPHHSPIPKISQQ